MATYRLIHQVAGTGERVSSLSHLEFRVWVQYQLSADDYGVCPAEAVKLQSDNLALKDEGERRVQAAIEQIIAVHLCGVFQDGRRRYLYQTDWQDRQKLKHFTATSYPTIPITELEKCSTKTRVIFIERSLKIGETLERESEKISPRVRARDAHAHADASADAHANAPAPLTDRPGPRRHAPGALAGSLPRDFMDAGFIGARFSVSEKDLADFARRHSADEQAGRLAVLAWLRELHHGLGPDESPGNRFWVEDQFNAWLIQLGKVKAAPKVRPAAAKEDLSATIAQLEGR